MNFLNKYKMFFEFMVNNKESWYIQNGQLYFEDETLLDEYNKLLLNHNIKNNNLSEVEEYLNKEILEKIRKLNR